MEAEQKIIELKPMPRRTRQTSSTNEAIQVGLVQINNSFSGQNYLPYSLACLRSYAESHATSPQRYRFLPFIYKRMPINQIVDRLVGADIVGFSTYVWNANISLEVARRLKALNPKVVIVFGGPQVPDKPEAFLRSNPTIDIVVHNEGERIFLELLEAMPSRDWSGIGGVSYLTEEGLFVKAPPGERMRDLAELPSPFLGGMLDELMAQNPNEKWIGLWETNRGCPFQCTFCDWGSATGSKVSRFELERLFSELDWFVRHKVEYIFVCDANFGSQKRDIEIAQHVATLRKATRYPQGFSVQSTKNATEKAYLTQKILSDAGLNKGVALSMQSLDPATLKNIKRDNISLDTYLELSRRFTRERVETYSDLILGLPGETYESFLKGVDLLIDSGQHNRIQFNNLTILPNAEMGDPDYLKRFQMVTVRSEIVNVHGTKEALEDDVPEMQDTVIETYSMNAADWRRSRAMAWMISFLYFDKLVQIPIVMLRQFGNLTYREIFEMFMLVDRAQYPVIGEIRDFFLAEAASIQNGGFEYVYSERWLGVYWPADEYVYIRLTADQQFDHFYSEVARLFDTVMKQPQSIHHKNAIEDAIRVNRALVNQPYQLPDISLDLRFNVIEFWRGVCEGTGVGLEGGQFHYKIRRTRADTSFDFLRWCKEVVWWGNKKGAYLYPIDALSSTQGMPSEIELAGHH